MRELLLSVACLLLISFPLDLRAQQSTTAALSGTISDEAGAVIPDARVTAVSTATGVERTATTNDEGYYVLPNLPADTYRVRVQAQGFSPVTIENIELQVGQTRTLDATPRIGVTEEVTLDGESSGFDNDIDTTTSVVDEVISEREIETLPLNGRNFLELALLIPGNAPAPNFVPTKTNTLVISSAGQLGRGSNVTIDGADNNDDAAGGPLQNISQDAVQEFQIATNRFSAESGRSASSVINVVTKSGTNDLFGSASIYERDRRLQGLPATFDRNTGVEPPFDRQQYSFTIGGPIRRDRAWFFGSFEQRNQDGAVGVGDRDVQTRRIIQNFAAAPLDNSLGNFRTDFQPTDDDRLTARYSLERLDSIEATTLVRAIGSTSQLQNLQARAHSLATNYTRVLSPVAVNSFNFNVTSYDVSIEPTVPGAQLTFPSVQDGASFRIPQETRVRRLQFSDSFTYVAGNHTLKTGADVQRIDALYNLRVFQQGRVEFVENFASADRNSDGRVDDNDLLFAVTLRSARPDRDLFLPNTDNNYLAFFLQDDWKATPNLAFNLGLRYEIDTDANNISGYDELNPLLQPFLTGTRRRDTNNFSPRVGFNYATKDSRTSIHGGYGIYYDRIVLTLLSFERGLDGRNLAIAVRAGNAARNPATGRPLYLDAQGRFLPGAPTISNPFTGINLPPSPTGTAGSGINVFDNGLQNPMVQQFNIGVERQLGRDFVARLDYIHNFGTNFIIGRTVGVVQNPNVGGADRVIRLESSAKTKYDGLLASVEKRFSNNIGLRASYTLSKAFNYANDDQVPLSNGPVNSESLRGEYGPTPNDQRHRFVFSGAFDLPRVLGGARLSTIYTAASAVPMDILLPDGSSRIPVLQRNAGGRIFRTGADLNRFIRETNAAGGVAGQPLPLVRDDAEFNDDFSSFDVRLSKQFRFRERIRFEPLIEVFNLFNTTNILGISNVNYSGFTNTLVRDSNQATNADGTPNPAFLRSSSFGRPVTTAGGVFGSGGARAFQLAARFNF